MKILHKLFTKNISAKKFIVLFILCIYFYRSNAQNDLPSPTSNIQTIPAGAWIIPMGNNYQGNASGIFKLKTYGLLNQLLWNNIPLKWAIKAGKGKDSTDFSVISNMIFPSVNNSNLIAGANFETTTLTPNWTYSNSGGGTNSTASKFNDARSWRMQKNHSITMSNTSLANYSNVQLSVAFASIGNPPVTCDLFMDISYDNGATWTGTGTVKLASGDGSSFFNINTTNVNTVSPNPYIVNIPSTASQISVRFRTPNLGTWGSAYYYIDDIKLTGTLNRPFVSGPFIIMPTDTAAARTVINTYNSTLVGIEKINVYKAENSFSADIRYNVTHKPKIAIYDDGGNSNIHEAVLTAAGISSTYYTVLNSGVTIDSLNCYTFASTPHWGVSSYSKSDSARLLGLRSFLRAGGNFLSQCEGIDAVENFAPSRYLTTNGVNALNASPTTILYNNTDMPVMQFHGIMTGPGGSIKNFNKTTGSWVYPRYIGTYFITGGDTANIVNVTKVTNTPNSIGGNMIYLAGHSYSGSNIENINGMRIYLNAVFMPAKDLQTNVTATSNSPICSGDSIRLYANTFPGFSFSWSGPNGFSSTQQNPVIPNATSTKAGTYTLTMTVPSNGGGCVYTYSSTAVIVNIPSISVTSTAAAICKNDSVTLSLSSNTGLSTANWYTNTGGSCLPNGTNVGTGFTKVVAPSTTTKYIAVAITSTGGCKDTTTNCFTVTVDTLPVLTSPVPTTSTLCYGRGTYATINPGGGGSSCTETYQWRKDGGAWQSYTSGTVVGTNATDSVEIRANRNCASGCVNKVVRLKWNVTIPQTTIGSGNLFPCVSSNGYTGTLTSTNPSPSTGVWSKISGPGLIASPTSFSTSISNLSKSGQSTVVSWIVTNANGCKDSVIVNFNPPAMDSSMVSKYSNEFCLTCPIQDGNTFSYFDTNGKLLARVTDSADAVNIGYTTFCGQLPYNISGNPTLNDVNTVNSWIQDAGYIPQPYLPRVWNLRTTNNAAMTVNLYFTDQELAALMGRTQLDGGYFDFGGDVNKLLLVAYPNAGNTFIPASSPNGIVYKPDFEYVDGNWQATFKTNTSATFYIYPTYWAARYGLPVELTSLKATALINSIQLNWSTASELNNLKFNVERSTNSTSFEKIGEVAGNGNSNIVRNYEFNDNNVDPDIHYYYRLVQVDYDGTNSKTDFVSAVIKDKAILDVDVFKPNPASNYSFIKINSPKSSNFNFAIYNTNGDLVSQNNYAVEKGISEVRVDFPGIANGLYLISITSESGAEMRKIIIKN